MNITSARNSKGIDIYFLALIDIIYISQYIPDLFIDLIFNYSCSNLVSMLSLNYYISTTSIFPMTEDRRHVSYLIEENRLVFLIVN